MQAYHVTDISNVVSILKNGLVPSIGKNSRSVHEHNFLTYFSTPESINTWIKTFGMKDTIILKFNCDSFNKRIGTSEDYFTKQTINPENITIENIPLEEYYKSHKESLDSSLEESVQLGINQVTNNLNSLEDVGKNDDAWNLKPVDPNIVELMDLLIKLRSLDDKNKFKDDLGKIITRIKEKLLSNDLELDSNSALLKSLDIIYYDVMREEPKISLELLNYITTIFSINLYYRQLRRYNKNGTLFTDENRIWEFDRLPISDITKKIYEDKSFIELFEETNSIKDNQIIMKA